VSDKIRTVLNDILFVFLLGLATIIFAMIYHINPVGKKNEEEVKSPGQIIAELRWFPDDLNCDVDLWVQGPGDRPVGYSNLRGRTWNLLRDDLGHGSSYIDFLGLNYEHAYTRGMLPGEYTVNVHLYRCNLGPVPVKVQISMVMKNVKRMIHTSEFVLSRQGEEVTVDRFTLDENFRDTNHHSAYKQLRSGSLVQ
jgi:hypothetical protein